jgi:DNA polymerase I-like protein with 3'-5' exonuclease and polymerase domains
MSETGFKFPNVRKMFIPDPGKVLIDADLSGADAQVVAWETNDPLLKEACRTGVKLHAQMATSFFGPSSAEKHPEYDNCKRAIHGTNYGAKARTIAVSVKWKIATAENFQKQWFREHPGIVDWHRRTELALRKHNGVRNRFGYSITYFDRVDALLPEALAWVPQSTVAIVCFRGGAAIRRIPGIEMLATVHDSLIFQIPRHWLGAASKLELIKKTLEVEVPYDEPLIIPWSLASSEKSWGDATKLAI